MSRSELQEILAYHAKKYPNMQPCDAVKLIYQNEFGGGHMIRNEESCLRYLCDEFARTPQNVAPLTESIGNGIVRVNLSSLSANSLPPEKLCEIFIRSSNEHKGSVDSFREKLSILRESTEEGLFSFTPEALSEYLAEYERAGFPAVSHSNIYRESYKPAYRIVLEKYLHEVNENG